MKRRIGCIFFSLVGLVWSAYVALRVLFSFFGDCGDDQACYEMQNAHALRELVLGLGVGLLIYIAYALFRRFAEDKNV